MKLDPAALRYLTDDDFRVLTAVEMGMRNHELVPVPLISAISGLRHGGYMRALKQVHKYKLVHKESVRYVGYRLTNLGYDYLAMRALVRRGVIEAIGRPLGVGKEADVFVVTASEQLMDEHPELADEPLMAMKLHRLGRTSFRAVKSKRDYLVHRKAASWIYFSRLAAIKEYAFMCALHQRGFPVPRPLGQSRHVVVMELCKGTLLNAVHELDDPVVTANILIEVATRFAQHGLVHCDLNEFNVMVDEDGEITVIDLPQTVSTLHADAKEMFDRDVNGIRRFFQHRFGVSEEDMVDADFSDIIAKRGDEERLDTIVAASGFRNTVDKDKDDDDTDMHKAEGVVNDGAHDVGGIDLKSLEISMVQREEDTEEDRGAQDDGTKDEAQSVSEEEEGWDGDQGLSVVDGEKGERGVAERSGINQAAIEARVRRQRGNQKRQVARRNVVKDSVKRKVKVEMDCQLWR